MKIKLISVFLALLVLPIVAYAMMPDTKGDVGQTTLNDLNNGGGSPYYYPEASEQGNVYYEGGRVKYLSGSGNVIIETLGNYNTAIYVADSTNYRLLEGNWTVQKYDWILGKGMRIYGKGKVSLHGQISGHYGQKYAFIAGQNVVNARGNFEYLELPRLEVYENKDLHSNSP